VHVAPLDSPEGRRGLGVPFDGYQVSRSGFPPKSSWGTAALMRRKPMPIELFSNLLEMLPFWAIPGWKSTIAPKSGL
jgi:hypothetical protein